MPEMRTRFPDGRIYIASKVVHGPKWLEWRDAGIPIISSWIEECGDDPTNFLDLWTRCLAEAATCSAFVIFREPGEILEGAFFEMGAALAAGVPVFAVGIDNLTIRHHPNVTCLPTVEEAFAAARKVARAPVDLPPNNDVTALAIALSDAAEELEACAVHFLVMRKTGLQACAQNEADSARRTLDIVRKAVALQSIADVVEIGEPDAETADCNP